MLLWACKSQLLHFQESCKSVIKHSLKLARVGAFTSGKLASATSHSSPPPVPSSGCLTFTSLSLDAVLLNSVFLCSKTAQTITSFVISWEMKNDLAEPITCVSRWQGKWNCPFIVWPKLETFTVLCHKRILYIVSIWGGGGGCGTFYWEDRKGERAMFFWSETFDTTTVQAMYSLPLKKTTIKC